MHLKWWLRSSMRWVPGRWGNALKTTEHRANVTALGALWTLQQAPTPRHTPSDLPRNVRTFPGKLNSSLRALLPRRGRTRPQNQGRIYRADRRYAKAQPQTPQNCDPEASWRFCVRDNLRVKTQLPVFTVSSPAVLTANRCAIAGHRCGEAQETWAADRHRRAFLAEAEPQMQATGATAPAPGSAERKDGATLDSLPLLPASVRPFRGLGQEVTHRPRGNNSFPRARRAPGSGGEAGANRKAFRVGLLLRWWRGQRPARLWGVGCEGTRRRRQECEVGGQAAVGAHQLPEATEAGVGGAKPRSLVE